MKILLVTHYFEGHGGGVELVAGIMARKLLEGGAFHITWAASATDAPPENIRGLNVLKMRAFNTLEKKISVPYPIWSPVSIKRLFKETAKAEVVHIHDYIYFGNMLTYVFSKILKKPVIITQHIGLVKYKNFLLNMVLGTLNRTAGYYMLKHAERSVFISETVRSYFTNIKGRKGLSGTEFIPNGVDCVEFYPLKEKERDEARNTKNFQKEENIFLFVGRFVEKKGLSIIRSLAENFPDVAWVIAGWGDIDPGKWDLPNVRVFYRPGRNELVQLYQISDLMVLPSRGEGFPLVVQESMACGTPVILNDEVAEGYPPAGKLIFKVSGLPGEDIISWRKALQEIISNSLLQKVSREKTAMFARHHWDWGRCVAKYTQIFKELSEKSEP